MTTIDPQHTSSHFHTLGHFEEVVEVATGKMLGTRDVVPEAGRQCGFHGQREETLTTPVELKRGHTTRTYKASLAKPLRIRTTLQIKCGRMLREIQDR